MARSLADDISGAGHRHLMGSAGSCVTEVRLSSVTPAAGLERLHLYLPSSHYSYGAVYTSIEVFPTLCTESVRARVTRRLTRARFIQ